MLVQPPRKQPGNHVEIFVVVRGEPARVALGLRNRATGRRRVPGNFEFSRCLHGARPDAGELRRGSENSVRKRFDYGITATFISPLRCFMCSNIFGSSASGISAFTKSLERISPRDTASSASRMNRGVWWNVDLIVISE